VRVLSSYYHLCDYFLFFVRVSVIIISALHFCLLSGFFPVIIISAIISGFLCGSFPVIIISVIIFCSYICSFHLLSFLFSFSVFVSVLSNCIIIYVTIFFSLSGFFLFIIISVIIFCLWVGSFQLLSSLLHVLFFVWAFQLSSPL
jgi:hypothetical protein